MLTKAMVHGGKVAGKQVQTAVQKTEGAVQKVYNVDPTGTERSAGESGTNELFCVGYLLNRGQAQVFLSDGSIWDSKDGEVGKVYKRKVIVMGVEYKIVPRWPSYEPVLPATAVSSVVESQDPGMVGDRSIHDWTRRNVKLP